MRIGYLDCFSGASGDMILGALIDCGLSPRSLREELAKLDLPHVRLRVRKVLKGGIAATRVLVEGKDETHGHRNLRELLRIVNRSRLDREIKERTSEVFHRIASAEGKIHRKPDEEVHFHEIGGLDSVVDITGAVWGFRQLGIERLYVSRVNVGGGFVKCEHGILPVPAPATVALMLGRPIYSSGVERELLTPTGAGLLTSLGSEFGWMPLMEVERVGYGAGRDELPHPNVLRLMIGRPLDPLGQERVAVIETNIDDMNPQIYDYLIEKLLAMGVLDVFLTPILMKKSRPATLLTVICPSDRRSAVTGFILRETTTLGLRWREEERAKADREMIRLDTKYGKIHFKMARWGGRMTNLSPEYEDCKRLASEKRVPLKAVFDEARRVATTKIEGR